MIDALAEALRGDFAKIVADLIFDKMKEHGTLPTRQLLNPAEAADYLGGFTESAFNQAEWPKTIPVVKIGIKTFYRVADLDAFTISHRMHRQAKR